MPDPKVSILLEIIYSVLFGFNQQCQPGQAEAQWACWSSEFGKKHILQIINFTEFALSRFVSLPDQIVGRLADWMQRASHRGMPKQAVSGFWSLNCNPDDQPIDLPLRNTMKFSELAPEQIHVNQWKLNRDSSNREALNIQRPSLCFIGHTLNGKLLSYQF